MQLVREIRKFESKLSLLVTCKTSAILTNLFYIHVVIEMSKLFTENLLR